MGGILVVDDNPNIRQLLRVFIETQIPYKVCGEASNGADAIEEAKRLEPDLVLIDLLMPELNGLETATILRRMMPTSKIVLFSLHFNEIPKTFAATIGIDLTISKADGIKRLGEHVKALLA